MPWSLLCVRGRHAYGVSLWFSRVSIQFYSASTAFSMVALNTGLGLAAEGPCGLIRRVQNQGAVTTGMPLPKPSHKTRVHRLLGAGVTSLSLCVSVSSAVWADSNGPHKQDSLDEDPRSYVKSLGLTVSGSGLKGWVHCCCYHPQQNDILNTP